MTLDWTGLFLLDVGFDAVYRSVYGATSVRCFDTWLPCVGVDAGDG